MDMRFIAVALIASLAACATTPIPITKASAVPAERIFVPTTTAGPAAKAIFVRDTGLLGSGVFHHLYINGKLAASLDGGEKIEIRLPPGEYIFGVKPTDPFGSAAVYSIDQQLKQDLVYTYRLLVDGNSFMARLQRTPNEAE